MITTAIINLAYSVVSWFIGLFPVGSTFPEEVHSSVLWLGGFFMLLNDIIPISSLVAIIVLVFSLELSLFGFRTLKWIISHLPFVGGK